MRVALTGGDGYLGRVVADALLARGWQVRCLDSGLFDACGFPHATAQAAVVPVRRDIRDLSPEDFDGCAAVVHLAGLSNDPLGELCPELTFAINHFGAVRAAETARAAGVGTFIAASSCSVYGASGDDVLDEGSPTAPVTAYARAKLAMEQSLASLATDTFAPVFLRPATVYGLSPRLRFDLVVNNLTAWAAATGTVRLKSDGTAWRPIVHVRDVARAIAAIVELPAHETRLQVLNVVDSAANFRVRDLAAMVAAAIPGTRIETAPDALRDARNYRVGGAKLAALIGPGWASANPEAEIAAMHHAFTAAGVTVAEFEGPRYQRLAHLKARLAAGELTPDLYPSGREGAATA